jgi:hypothetical protein
MAMLVPVKARALELLEHHAREANPNRVYAVSRLELAQAAYGCVVPTRSMLSSLGRALNDLAREGALVRLTAGTEALWGVARHARTTHDAAPAPSSMILGGGCDGSLEAGHGGGAPRAYRTRCLLRAVAGAVHGFFWLPLP